MIFTKLKPLLSTRQIICRYFSAEKQWQEVSFPVPWGHISGKWWGPTNVRPILCLHGWQDNCGSFDRLIPLLNKDIGFLAIDLPGHGYSSRLPPGMFYHFTNYVILIRWLMEHLRWDKVSLMGHSLGGITSYTFTMLYPQLVDFLTCIDGVKPMALKHSSKYIAETIDNFLKNVKFSSQLEEPPSYTLDEIKQKVHAPNKGSINLDRTSYLMERNIAPSKVHPGKYYFTRDPRLKSDSFFNFSQADLLEYAHNLTCPIFIAKAKGASYYEDKENFYEVLDILKRSSIDCEYHYVEGKHHVHLNNPEQQLAGLLNKYFQKYWYQEDRTSDGLRIEVKSD